MTAFAKYLRWDTAVGVLLVAVFLAGAGTTDGFADTVQPRRPPSTTPPRSRSSRCR